MGDWTRGSCHCGAVEFEVRLGGGPRDLRRCNCSLCRRKGAVMASVGLDEFRIVRGDDKLTVYRWNTMTASHHFCSICGIYTHHRRRSDPRQLGFNVACVDGLDPFALGDVPVGNGTAQSLAPARATDGAG